MLLVGVIIYTVVVSKTYIPASIVVSTRSSRLSMDTLPPIAPMHWDGPEGAYMASLVVGNGVVELVLDTGSSQLSVKGPGCRWKTCSASGCDLQACPCGVTESGDARTNCEEFYYQPSGYKISPGDRGSGMNTTMTYGSQTDTIEHYVDTVHVPVSREQLTCSDLRLPPRKQDGPSDAIPNGGGMDGVIVHRVLHIEGSSSSNLLGLSRPNGGSVEHGSKVLLQTLVPSNVWSVVFHGSGGWLAFGHLPCFSPLHYAPMVQPKSFNSFLTSFYILKIVSISVGRDLAGLKEVAKPPKYCVVDTGTTSTYASTSFGKALDGAGYDERKHFFQIQLGDPSNPIVLTYSPQQLQDPEFPSQSVIEAWPGRTLDDYDQIFPPSHGGVILFGALMMNNMYWEFDVKNNRIGVAMV
jgi:hypothetical protein